MDSRYRDGASGSLRFLTDEISAVARLLPGVRSPGFDRGDGWAAIGRTAGKPGKCGFRSSVLSGPQGLTAQSLPKLEPPVLMGQRLAARCRIVPGAGRDGHVVAVAGEEDVRLSRSETTASLSLSNRAARRPRLPDGSVAGAGWLAANVRFDTSASANSLRNAPDDRGRDAAPLRLRQKSGIGGRNGDRAAAMEASADTPEFVPDQHRWGGRSLLPDARRSSSSSALPGPAGRGVSESRGNATEVPLDSGRVAGAATRSGGPLLRGSLTMSRTRRRVPILSLNALFDVIDPSGVDRGQCAGLR
jgi:hypothetical protein